MSDETPTTHTTIKLPSWVVPVIVAAAVSSLGGGAVGGLTAAPSATVEGDVRCSGHVVGTTGPHQDTPCDCGWEGR